MKRYLVLLVSLIVLLSGCNLEKAFILFSSDPITVDTFSLDKRKVSFLTEQRIYFVLYNPKPFTSSVLRLQILKLDRKTPYYEMSIVQGRDIEIDASKDYATDYFCLHQEGYYILRLFSKDKLEKPIAEAYFEVTSP